MASEAQISGGITSLLQRWSQGDAAVLDSLIEVAYGELHAMAGGYLRQQSGDKAGTRHAVGSTSERTRGSEGS